jgi:Tfp pilus assembly protein PilF
MNPSPERAQALITRQRWDLAERELNAALTTDPHDPMALGLLALCLAKRHQLKDARRAAGEALRLAPDWAFTHHVMASVLSELEEGRKAEAAAREAIRLDPSNPDHQAMLAQVHLQQRAWRKALAAAERGRWTPTTSTRPSCVPRPCCSSAAGPRPARSSGSPWPATRRTPRPMPARAGPSSTVVTTGPPWSTFGRPCASTRRSTWPATGYSAPSRLATPCTDCSCATCCGAHGWARARTG